MRAIAGRAGLRCHVTIAPPAWTVSSSLVRPSSIVSGGGGGGQYPEICKLYLKSMYFFGVALPLHLFNDVQICCEIVKNS